MKETSGGLRPSLDWNNAEKPIYYKDLSGDIKVTTLNKMIESVKKDTK